MRWTWTVCVVAAAAAAASSFAQEAKEETERLVVKARITGAVITPEDSPMLLAWPEGRGLASSRVETKFTVDTGRMESVITTPKPAGPGRVELVFAGHPERGRVIAFVERLCGELDLGDVAMGADAPPLLSGRVVSPDGKPARGAKVSVKVEYASHRITSFEWTESDAIGAFTCRGDVRGATRLLVETDGKWRSERPLSFVPGAKDVTIVASATVSVHGTLELPKGLPFDDLVVVMKGPPGGTDSVRMPDGVKYGFGGTNDRLQFAACPEFRIDGLVPGAYDVIVRFREATRPLFRMKDVTVDATTDALPPLRVTTPPRRVVARVVGADGAPIAGASVFAREKGDSGKYRGRPTGPDGKREVVFVGDEVELAARAEGTDYVFQVCGGGEATLRLGPPARTPVAIEWPDGGARTAEGGRLTVALSWRAPPDVPQQAIESVHDETDPRSAETLELRVPDSGPVRASVSVPGWYQLMFRVRRGGGWAGRELGTVRVAGAEQVSVPLGMSTDEVREAIRSLSER